MVSIARAAVLIGFVAVAAAPLSAQPRVERPPLHGALDELSRTLPVASWTAPEFPRGRSHVGDLARLEAFATELGFLVAYERRPAGAVLDRPVHRIRISRSLSTDGRLHVLAHELAHVLEPDVLTASNDQPAVDVYAEAVAYLVGRELGMAPDFSIAYLRRLPSSSWRVLVEHQIAIERTAARLIQATRR